MRRVILLLTVLVVGCTPAPAPPAPTVAPPVPVVTTGAVTVLPPLRMPRAGHTATTLPDGRVLVVGGCTRDGCGGTPEGRETELFDPRTRAFTLGPSLGQGRVGHTATRLVDGRVLIVGGFPDEGRPPLATAEIYDPETNDITATGAMEVGRGAPTATLLRDGRVLVVGGDGGGATAELYDPLSGSFHPARSLPEARSIHAATLLRDGRVLVAGGRDSAGRLLESALVYNPVGDSWQAVGPLHEAKYKLAVVGLRDGTALVVGGQTRDDPAARLATTELFDPRANRFRAGPTMAEPRYKISDAVVLLPDGRLVISGGRGVEVYDAGRLTRLGAVPGPERQFPAAAALTDGTVLVTGGYDNSTRVTASSVLVDP
jgi:hypothetical protein